MGPTVPPVLRVVLGNGGVHCEEEAGQPQNDCCCHRWAERLDFLFCMDGNTAMRTRAALSGQRRDQAPLTRMLQRQTQLPTGPSSTTSRGACTRPYRVVVRRKNVSKMKGEHMLVEGIRIFRVGLQRTNNMRRYTASSPISKRYTYTPVATARPCSSRASQVRRCSPAWRVSAASTRTRWPVRL